MSDQRRQMENQNAKQEQVERIFSSSNNQRQISSNQQHLSDDEKNIDDNSSISSGRGFAAMSPERQKEIASEGGRAAHRQGVAHEWNSEEARNAGRKGGQSVSQNREHMSEIGRRGGQSSGGRRKNQQSTE